MTMLHCDCVVVRPPWSEVVNGIVFIRMVTKGLWTHSHALRVVVANVCGVIFISSAACRGLAPALGDASLRGIALIDHG